jgi:8-oxo-dGTP diphosphatase
MKEISLLVTAIVLLFWLLPIVFLYMLLKYVITGNLRMLTIWSKRVAMSLDVFANVHASEIFNDILIKKGGYKFGNKQETISSVMGKNQRDGTLTIIGKGLRIILDVIEYGHCILSINDELTNTRK